MKKQRIFYLFYAAVFGWMGGHRYYVGEKTLGIFHTIFFWTLIPAILALVAFIIYALKTDKEFDAIHNR